MIHIRREEIEREREEAEAEAAAAAARAAAAHAEASRNRVPLIDKINLENRAAAEATSMPPNIAQIVSDLLFLFIFLPGGTKLK